MYVSFCKTSSTKIERLKVDFPPSYAHGMHVVFVFQHYTLLYELTFFNVLFVSLIGV